jgi:hypothetical protein
MDRTMDIIPISSRRRGGPPPAKPASVPAPKVRSGLRALGFIAGGLLFVAIIALSHQHELGTIREMPAAQRVALYQRTLDEARTTCASPDAREGALRDHCIGQAEFLLLFPECDAGCQRLTFSILPHARR